MSTEVEKPRVLGANEKIWYGLCLYLPVAALLLTAFHPTPDARVWALTAILAQIISLSFAGLSFNPRLGTKASIILSALGEVGNVVSLYAAITTFWIMGGA